MAAPEPSEPEDADAVETQVNKLKNYFMKIIEDFK